MCPIQPAQQPVTLHQNCPAVQVYSPPVCRFTCGYPVCCSRQSSERWMGGGGGGGGGGQTTLIKYAQPPANIPSIYPRLPLTHSNVNVQMTENPYVSLPLSSISELDMLLVQFLSATSLESIMSGGRAFQWQMVSHTHFYGYSTCTEDPHSAPDQLWL